MFDNYTVKDILHPGSLVEMVRRTDFKPPFRVDHNRNAVTDESLTVDALVAGGLTEDVAQHVVELSQATDSDSD